MSAAGSSVVIVSPALSDANNGNWRTASRWACWAGVRHRVRIVKRWPDQEGAGDELMIALHANRSSDSIGDWIEARGGGGRLAVVLTGTDLYQDLVSDERARGLLARVRRLVVLQDRAVDALPQAWRSRSRVIYQSTNALPAVEKTADHLHVVMVGHLRAVKDPQCLWQAARRLPADAGIRIDHIGEATEPGWAAQAMDTEAASPHLRWLGPLPHHEVRAAIQRAHLLVHTSVLEGGAHVIMEAVRSGTPVLASRVDGNVGMLGPDYAGYFAQGDSAALAELLLQCRLEQQQQPQGPLLQRLQRQCALRAPLFDPATEQAGVLSLIEELSAP